MLPIAHPNLFDGIMEPEQLRQHEAALAVYLAKDDMTGWQTTCDGINAGLTDGSAEANAIVQRCWTKGMVRWFVDNAVHAFEQNPQVTEAWTRTVPRLQYDTALHVLLARGLEDIPDHEKIDLLQGRGVGKAKQSLHAFFLRGRNREYWTLVSPAWVGAPGTALRQAALDAGWNLGVLPTQIHRQLKAFTENPQNTPPTWTSWMAFPHCAVVLYELHQMESLVGETTQHFACVPTLPWADPRDVALAQAIADQGPATFHCVVGNGEPPTCSPQEHGRLRELVKVYNGLGLWSDLETGVLQGTIDGLSAATPQGLVLPDLGEGSTP